MRSPSPGDSSGRRGQRKSHFCGSSSHTSSHVATSLAPCLMSVFGPQEFLLVTLPGTAKTSRFCSSAQRAVMRVPLYSAASTTSTPIDMPLMMRLRIGKFCGAANVPSGNLGDERPAERDDLVREAGVLLWVNNVDSRSEHGHRFPFAEIAPRWPAVSTPRAMPLRMTSPRAARSMARRSAMPDP